MSIYRLHEVISSPSAWVRPSRMAALPDFDKNYDVIILIIVVSHASASCAGEAIEQLDATQRVRRIVAAVVRQIGVA
jgi:hypothetical protein